MIAGTHALYIGFELMGNPRFDDGSDDGIFTSWGDVTELLQWRKMTAAIALRSIDAYGLENVSHWRWEAWNEPDHCCNNIAKMKANIDCDLQKWIAYIHACVAGLKDAESMYADARLLWGGPGSGGATLKTPFLTALLEDHIQNKTRLDFIAWHKKGLLNNSLQISNLEFDNSVIEHINDVLPESNLSLGNEEADPMGDWAKVVSWRGDASYPAAAAKILLMHQQAFRMETPISAMVNYNYHANDNAFLNYGDKWFDQRTLTARFLMNKTGAVEVIKKPIINLMVMLSLLGDIIYEGTGFPDSIETMDGLMVTSSSSQSQNGFNEVAVLIYRCPTLVNSEHTLAINTTFSIDIEGFGLLGKQYSMYEYRIDEYHTNPRRQWMSFGSPSYPNPNQFSAIRNASHLSVVASSTNQISPHNYSLSVNLSSPAITLVHFCLYNQTRELQPLKQVTGVAVRATSTLVPPTVMVTWKGRRHMNEGRTESGCLVAGYEVWWSKYEKFNGISSYAQVSPDDSPLLYSAFIHAQLDTLGQIPVGCYKIRAVGSAAGLLSPFSAPVCV